LIDAIAAVTEDLPQSHALAHWTRKRRRSIHSGLSLASVALIILSLALKGKGQLAQLLLAGVGLLLLINVGIYLWAGIQTNYAGERVTSNNQQDGSGGP
jgi:predicted Na+-dependent transporter